MWVLIEVSVWLGLIVGSYEYFKGSRNPIKFQEKTIKIEI